LKSLLDKEVRTTNKSKINKQKIDSQLKRIAARKIKVKPFNRFRAIAKSIVVFFMLHKQMKRFKVDMQDTREGNVSTVHAFNLALLKTWFIYKFPIFFRNVINYDESINFTKSNSIYVSNDTIKRRFSKARPFVLYFFKRLKAVTNLNDMPKQFLSFINEFFSHGSSIEPMTLTEFELDRIDLDEFDTLYNVDQKIKDFLRLYFIIGKGLLRITMLSEEGFGRKLNSTSKDNLKVIASIIYHSMMDHLRIIVAAKGEYNQKDNTKYEPISKQVYSKDDIEYMTSKHPVFYEECRKSFEDWLKMFQNLLSQSLKLKEIYN